MTTLLRDDAFCPRAPLGDGAASHWSTDSQLSREHLAPVWGGLRSSQSLESSHQSSCHHRVRGWGEAKKNGGLPENQDGEEEGGTQWPQAKAVRAQGHGASVSLLLWGGPLRSSNVSSTTCHRQLSSGNSLSTRLTRK